MAQERTYLQRALNIWGIVVILWAFYRAFFVGVPAWLEEFVIKPFIFLYPVYSFFKHSVKRSFAEELGIKTRKLKEDIALFLILTSAIFFVLMFLLPSLPQAILRQGNIYYSILLVAISMAASFTEELLLRGFVVHTLYKEWKNFYQAVFFGSLLSVVIYVPIFFAKGSFFRGNEILIVLAITFMVSLISSMLFLIRRSIWLPVGFHFAYTLIILSSAATL